MEPQPGLPTGTQIRNVALISFDRQPSIATDQIDPLDPAAGTDPTKQALITIDDDSPVSAVLPLPAITREPVFEVRWNGTDLGAGIADFDVYVSTNGGPWNLWIAATPTNSAGFLGEHGNTYAFYSIARDYVGHVELPPATADASTTVLLPPPFSVSIEFLDDTQPDSPSVRVTYPVEPDFDYYVEFRAVLDSEDAWQVLPDGPHNTGPLTLPIADAPQFFRVQRISR